MSACKDEGIPWDSSNAEMRKEANDKLIKDEKFPLIGSPMCINFSSIMNPNWSKMRSEERSTRMTDARSLLNVCVELYRAQRDAGTRFPHERMAGLRGVIETHQYVQIWNAAARR